MLTEDFWDVNFLTAIQKGKFISPSLSQLSFMKVRYGHWEREQESLRRFDGQMLYIPVKENNTCRIKYN